MKENKSVPIMLTVPKDKRDQLKKLVSTINLKNPDANKTISGLSREIIENYLKEHYETDNQKKNVFKMQFSKDVLDEHDDFI